MFLGQAKPSIPSKALKPKIFSSPPPNSPSNGTPETVKPYRLYILDLDGTLYRGEEPCEDAIDSVAKLQAKATVKFLTNNSSVSRPNYVRKLNRLGFAAREDDIHSSATGAAHWLRENRFSSAYAVGEQGLFDTLRAGGIELVNDRQADAVVGGLNRQFTYDILNEAMQQILGGAKFVATNVDSTYPMEAGKLIPGTGSLIAAIQSASGTEPFVIGKPNPYLIEMILRETGIPPTETLVVGDREETDIVSGQQSGCDTHLVLTGITQEPKLASSVSRTLAALV
jgi:4-nitrophenyl phosphatase